MPEYAEQIITPHFRQSDWKRECVLKFELAITIQSVAPRASKIAYEMGWTDRCYLVRGTTDADASCDGWLVRFEQTLFAQSRVFSAKRK